MLGPIAFSYLSFQAISPKKEERGQKAKALCPLVLRSMDYYETGGSLGENPEFYQYFTQKQLPVNGQTGLYMPKSAQTIVCIKIQVSPNCLFLSATLRSGVKLGD